MDADQRRSFVSKSSTVAVFRAFLLRKARQILSLISWFASGKRLYRYLRLSASICGSTLFLSLSINAQLPTPALPPASPELEARLKKLETELRCLVCQNQTLADSPAGLAGDLRREVRLLADQGKSNDEIKAHLRARYGDFVLYKPEVEPKTWLLWGGPFLLLAGGAGVFFFMNRRRTAAAAPASPPASALPPDQERARKLLDDE
ncbi:MAG: cytochrome c-type biogenesis protein CcmH [Betaproteobacteria bacterium]|nr:cytochrome c-type biogenesis protein CcmH [Betaproteobacteria bacterium]